MTAVNHVWGQIGALAVMCEGCGVLKYGEGLLRANEVASDAGWWLTAAGFDLCPDCRAEEGL